MKKLKLSIEINAPVEKVYKTTIGADTYPLWTEVFCPGSNIKGSWEEGSRILFISPNGQGGFDGMVSEIAENKKNKFISIRHIGLLRNGIEDTTSDSVRSWAPSFENYAFIDKNGKTEFVLEMDVEDQLYDMFLKVWPKALEMLKEIAETGRCSSISVSAWIKSSPKKVWKCYTDPEHITKWAFASDDWEAPYAENNVVVGGKFKTKMSARDKSSFFDFTGIYTKVEPEEMLEYVMDDGRIVSVLFITMGEDVQVIVTFRMETENSRELQKEGWQAILNNFKKHVESN